MKIKNRIFVVGASLMMVFGTISTVAAASVVSGTSYQRVTHTNIPGNGGIRFNMNYGSKKATTFQFATVKKIKADAWLGNFACLVDSSKDLMSEEVGISSSAKHFAEMNAKKGTTYFLAMCSSSLEPSNSCDTTVDFSADSL